MLDAVYLYDMSHATSPIVEYYLKLLTELSERDRLLVIARLSEGLVASQNGAPHEQPKASSREQSSLADLAGAWTHGSSADALVEEIYGARTKPREAMEF